MKRFLVLLAISAACLILTISAAPQTLPVLYDSSIKTPSPNASSGDIARVYKELLRVAGTQLKNQCFDSKLPAVPKLTGLARGAFTRKAAAQVAWLFGLCYTKRYPDHGFYGLVILESGRTERVSSIQLTALYATASELYSLRDINLNGKDELALVWQTGDSGFRMTMLALLEQTPSKLNALGGLVVQNGDYDYNIEWKVFVLKGNPPMFIATSKSGKPSPVELKLEKPELELQTYLVR